MLRPQDLLTLIKLALLNKQRQPARQIDLAQALGMSQTEIHKTLKRAAEARLYEPTEGIVMRRALVELLTHGVKYIYPAHLGAPTRGVPTGWAAPPLASQISGGDDLERPVWPHPEGRARGAAVEPLYPSAPDAALKDPELYEVLALVDALRIGSARERKLAEKELEKRLAA